MEKQDTENIDTTMRQKIFMIKSAPKEKKRELAGRLWLIM